VADNRKLYWDSPIRKFNGSAAAAEGIRQE
jgi:hypothetical protein